MDRAKAAKALPALPSCPPCWLSRIPPPASAGPHRALKQAAKRNQVQFSILRAVSDKGRVLSKQIDTDGARPPFFPLAEGFFIDFTYYFSLCSPFRRRIVAPRVPAKAVSFG
jgi:hypothetical protein